MKSASALLLPAFLCLTFLCLAAGVPMPAASAQEFEESYNQRFLKSHPLLDTRVQDTEVYAADGKPFKFSDARGKHTVVVFGCLT